MRVLLAVLILALPVFAGCIAPDEVDQASLTSDLPTDAVYASLAALLGDLPCDASSVPATGTSDNLLEAAAIAYPEGTVHGELDIRGEWLIAARLSNGEEDVTLKGGGFDVTNIRDPANAVVVAHYVAENDHALDVKFMPDNTSAIVGHGGSIDLVDFSAIVDSTLTPDQIIEANLSPKLVSVWTYPAAATGEARLPFSNMHMLFTARLDEVDYVFIAPNDNTGVWILKLTGEGDARELEFVTTAALPLAGGPLGPHDMWVGIDEITQMPIMYVSNGFEGWQAFDLTDPAAPKIIAIMPNLDPGQGYTHSIMAQKIGDRRIVATIAEVGVNMMKVWDATNLAAPILLAEWWGDRATPSNMQHNLQIVAGFLYVAHYGQGVYVFDLNKLGPTLPVVGTATIAPMAHFQPDAISVWDAALKDGVMYVNDISGGTRVVGFGCIEPGDVLQTSTG